MDWETYEDNDSMYMESDRKFDKFVAEMKLGLRKVPKITAMEREILEFCHERNMKEFIREEFEKHPIILDEEGGLVGRNPFDVEREKKRKEKPYIYEGNGYDSQ